MVIIGWDGFVRYNGFHIDPEQARRLIDRLKLKPSAAPAEGADAPGGVIP